MSKRDWGYLILGSLVLTSATSCTPGPSSSWKDSEIIRVSRQNNSGTYAYFKEAVLGEKREYKQGAVMQSGSSDVVALVSKTPAAIGYSGMGYRTPDVKVLSVSKEPGEEGIEPTVENVVSGRYPISRPLFLYTPGEPTGAVKDFINWILSEDGQKTVAEMGFVPLPENLIDRNLTAGADDKGSADGKMAIKVTGSDTMVNLAQAWAEAYQKDHPDVSIQVTGGGSGVGIAALSSGDIDIATASRLMKDKEKEEAKSKTGKEPKQIQVALDGVAIYVNKQNPLNSISIEELAEIYGEGGTITKWGDLKRENAKANGPQ